MEAVAVNTSRIPFARRRIDARMVDVANVPRGKACDCECPSCGLSVIARQGLQRDWHFAHASTDEATDDTTVCEYSTLVSMRLMSHQILTEIDVIRVPYGPGETGLQDRKLTIDRIQTSAHFEGVRVDAIADVQDYPLVIYLTYPSRQPPAALFTPARTEAGILEISLQSLLRSMENDTSWAAINTDAQQWLSRDVLCRWLAHGVESKSWIYHPRQARRTDANRPLLARYDCGDCGESWLAGYDDENAITCPKCKLGRDILVTPSS